MAWQTPKTNWGQPGQTVPGVADFNRIEENIRILGEYNRAPGYGTAIGINVKIITLDPAPPSYYDGLCFAFKNATQNTGPVTINVNGLGAKPIKKPNGKDLAAGNLKAGSIYTVRYNGTNFILQGSDSAGNATPGDVLSGKTFSNDDDTELVGTMPNIGLWAQILRNQYQYVYIPKGYHNGGGVVAVDIQNLVPENIKEGVNVGGVIGTLFDLGEPRYDYSDKLNFSITFYEIEDIAGGTTISRTKTCRKAGQYLIEGLVQRRTSYATQTFRIKIYINEVLVEEYEVVSEDGDPYQISLYYVADLNYGDTIRVQGYCSHPYSYTFRVESGFKKPDTSSFFD